MERWDASRARLFNDVCDRGHVAASQARAQHSVTSKVVEFKSCSRRLTARVQD